MGHVLYVDNTGYIQLQGYKNSLNNEYINDAIVTVEFTHASDGSSVEGLLPVLNLSYQANSDGDYQAVISETANINANDLLYAKVTATSSGIQSVFNCKVLVKERGCD